MLQASIIISNILLIRIIEKTYSYESFYQINSYSFTSESNPNID
jgi:hypothetical protein